MNEDELRQKAIVADEATEILKLKLELSLAGQVLRTCQLEEKELESYRKEANLPVICLGNDSEFLIQERGGGYMSCGLRKWQCNI